MTVEPRRLFPSLKLERNLWKNKYSRIAGIDEAGRGAWAGPVCAAVVILPPDPAVARRLSLVRDSKLMTPRARETWAPKIRMVALAWAVGSASAGEIDRLGIVPATKIAALRALDGLDADLLITDLLLFPEVELDQIALVKGDQRCLSVAAASVLAKTTRDALMCSLDSQFPGYSFSQHKGYGTSLHREAIEELGVCPEHRRSFSIYGKRK